MRRTLLGSLTLIALGWMAGCAITRRPTFGWFRVTWSHQTRF
jgi:hypothetical protein